MKFLLIIRSRYSTVVTNTRWHEILLQYRSQNWGDRSAQYWPNYWLFKLCGGTWGDIWDHLSYSVPCWPRWSHEQHIFWVADVWWPVLVDKDKTESTDIKSEGESWETCKGSLTRSYRPDGHGVDVMLTRRTSNCQIGQKVGLLSHDVSTANLPVKPKSVTN